MSIQSSRKRKLPIKFDPAIYNDLCQQYIDAHITDKTTDRKPDRTPTSRQKKVLKDIRAYLDRVGYRMPSPLYLYNEADLKTCRYIDIDQLNPGYAHFNLYPKTECFKRI